MVVTIYTDGGADPNPGVGGWAAILRAGDREKVLSGSDPSTTNNRMELTAAIAALEALTRPSQVALYTDSEYLRLGITERISKWQSANWQRKGIPIPNVDLWQALWGLTQQHDVRWHWVRGHAGNPLNERVDKLARDARLALTPAVYLGPDSTCLYVRGSCKGNPGPGAWGTILEFGQETQQMSGSESATTNNRMELTAVIEGLNMIAPGDEVHVITTSDYVFMGATRWIHGWRQRDWKKKDGQNVSNRDLWQRLDGMATVRDVHWFSAKGATEQFEQGLDEAARLARQALEMER
ncbi:MAG: ribonuclease HI [Chloroflexota bacterium]|nr:MAG: ribonuclease HI [Chloroflexota bacterium]